MRSWFGVVYVLAVLTFVAISDRQALAMYPLVPLELFFVVRGALLKTARVELEPDGVCIYNGQSPRARWVGWDDVQNLRVDPPGGLRQVRLRLSTGKDVNLPPLGDENNAVVTGAYRVATGQFE